MIIDPKKKIRDLYFYNNLLLMVIVFCIACFVTSIFLEYGGQTRSYSGTIRSGQTFGPIKIEKNKPKIYIIKSSFWGDNSSTYIIGEVLDENKDTLYEFGKDLWHESGYDSDGYWSESDRNMQVKLTFSEPGTYYIQMGEEKGIGTGSYSRFKTRSSGSSLQIISARSSGIPHLMMGGYFLLAALIIFVGLNPKWVGEKLAALNERLGEMND